MDLEKKLNVSKCLSLYEGLLTKHQADMLRLYYDCDISLFEIAEQCGISRQAVRDAIVRGEKSLEEFESKLHLGATLSAVTARLNKVCDMLPDNAADAKLELLQIVSEMEE